VNYVVLGWPSDGPRLRLHHERYAYAGKFVTGRTGVAVALPDGVPAASVPTDAGGYAEPVAAASFDEDRTDASTLVVRYVTVRADRRGEGVGPRLLAVVAAAGAERGHDRVRIATNNPFAFEAAHRAGFAWTGRETGLAELVCERPAARPADVDPERYRAGLGVYRERLDDGGDGGDEGGGVGEGGEGGRDPHDPGEGDADVEVGGDERSPEARFLARHVDGDAPAFVGVPAWTRVDAARDSGG
jgi:GNAT superfamily N-acetyltransferase